jgi:hypothetical protein
MQRINRSISIYITSIVMVIFAILVLNEGLFFVYCKLRGRPYSFYGGTGANIMDFHQAGLFVKDNKTGYILKPEASTSLLPDWEANKEQ